MTAPWCLTCGAPSSSVRRFLPDLIDRITSDAHRPRPRLRPHHLPMEQAAEGYAAMDERRAIKTLLQP
jgi:threonine dehydrogenase-like Zn-dependent dehydrogenase